MAQNLIFLISEKLFALRTNGGSEYCGAVIHKSIKDLKRLSGKGVILRVDFNVPIKDNKVVDDFRIQKALPTINFLSKKGANP